MQIEPEIDGAAVALVGNFNPTIFTPAWFALHGLLPEDVAENADLTVAHQQVVMFNVDWFRLEVTADRFHAETTQAPHIRIHDLVVRVFKEHLHHTPLTAFGINRSVHFQVESPAVRDHLGRMLAPVEPWGRWGRELGLDGEHGGMTSLTMTQVDPEERPMGGRINVTVEPSNLIGRGRTGVYVGINDHYAIGGSEPGMVGRMMELFEANFDASLHRSEQIVDHIMSLATNPEA